MPTTETWLVAHDLSPCSDVALEEAARVLERLAGQMVLVYVHPLLRLRPEEAWGQQTFRVTEALRVRLHDLAVAVRQRHPAVPVRVELVGSNDPVRGILDVARRLGVAHVVVGTHDRKGLEHLVLGSVAERVARQAETPVTVVRASFGARA